MAARNSTQEYSHDGSKKEVKKTILQIRDLVVSDPTAIEKWPTVVDHIVEKATDTARIKKLIERFQYDEAVLQSLRIWWQAGRGRGNLCNILREQGLDVLAGQIQESLSKLNPTGCQSTRSADWFEVGEVVYNFTGRESELEALHEMLSAAERTGRTFSNMICIQGLGGIGKSTLAREYARKHVDDYDGFIWINAETVDSMRASFIRLAKHLHLVVSDQTPNEEIVAAVSRTIQHKKCLFIFDNVEEQAHLKQFQPTCSNPHEPASCLLVTTRRNDLTPIEGNQLSLDTLTLDEAVQLIQKQMPNSTTAVAGELAEKLQRFPLALQQALAYIKGNYMEGNQETKIAQYVQDFDKSEGKLLKDARFLQHVQDYSMTTFTTWDLTMKLIKRTTGGLIATQIMSLIAYLSPESISTKLVTEIVRQYNNVHDVQQCLLSPRKALLNVSTTDADIGRSLKLLEKFSMITLNNGMVGVHRLVQQVVRINSSKVKLMSKILDVLNAELRSTEFRESMRELMAHGLHLFRFQVKQSELMKGRALDLGQLCYYLLEYRNYEECLWVAQQSATIYESLHSKKHESTILMKWRMAEAHHRLGNNSEALNILTEIRLLSRSQLGYAYWLTTEIESQLARTYSAMGDHEKAIEIYDQIIVARVHAYGKWRIDRHVLNAKHAKAVAVYRQGRSEVALQLFQEIYEKELQLLGESDLRTLQTLSWIADIKRDKGDFTGALIRQNQIYAGYKQILGEMHPSTIRSRNKVSTLEKKKSNQSLGT